MTAGRINQIRANRCARGPPAWYWGPPRTGVGGVSHGSPTRRSAGRCTVTGWRDLRGVAWCGASPRHDHHRTRFGSLCFQPSSLLLWLSSVGPSDGAAIRLHGGIEITPTRPRRSGCARVAPHATPGVSKDSPSPEGSAVSWRGRAWSTARPLRLSCVLSFRWALPVVPLPVSGSGRTRCGRGWSGSRRCLHAWPGPPPPPLRRGASGALARWLALGYADALLCFGC